MKLYRETPTIFTSTRTESIQLGIDPIVSLKDLTKKLDDVNTKHVEAAAYAMNELPSQLPDDPSIKESMFMMDSEYLTPTGGDVDETVVVEALTRAVVIMDDFTKHPVMESDHPTLPLYGPEALTVEKGEIVHHRLERGTGTVSYRGGDISDITEQIETLVERIQTLSDTPMGKIESITDIYNGFDLYGARLLKEKYLSEAVGLVTATVYYVRLVDAYSSM